MESKHIEANAKKNWIDDKIKVFKKTPKKNSNQFKFKLKVKI